MPICWKREKKLCRWGFVESSFDRLKNPDNIRHFVKHLVFDKAINRLGKGCSVQFAFEAKDADKCDLLVELIYKDRGASVKSFVSSDGATVFLQIFAPFYDLSRREQISVVATELRRLCRTQLAEKQ